MLELKNIQKSYNGNPVLEHIDFSVADGEIISVLGASGSGKTTLLNIILGIVRPDSGQILLDGTDITNTPMEDRGFNIVFQDYALFPNLSAYGNIVYGLRNKPGISTPEEVEDLISRLGLQEHLHKHIEQLSGGQKQRVALARTLVMKPKVLLLDEPLSALDGVIKESIKEKIRQIARDLHLTTIIVTHDPEEALSLSDRVMILDSGKVLQFDTPYQILHNPSDSFVEELILRQLLLKRDSILELFRQGAQCNNAGGSICAK